MIDVNDAYKQGRCGKIFMKSLHVVSNIKVYATQDGWPADRTWLTTNDPFVTHMDQKANN